MPYRWPPTARSHTPGVRQLSRACRVGRGQRALTPTFASQRTRDGRPS